MTRSFIAFGLLLIAVASAAPSDEKETPKETQNRRERWQQVLDKEKYDFRPAEASVVYCFGQYDAETRLQMVFDSKKRRGEVTFRFGDDGKVLELHGYEGAVFREDNNVLYFAWCPGWGSSQGCTVEAYDLRTGEQLWKTPLHVLDQVRHFAYSNEINLDMLGPDDKDSVIRVTGHESYGDYRAFLDMGTGEVLARRVYQQGW